MGKPNKINKFSAASWNRQQTAVLTFADIEFYNVQADKKIDGWQIRPHVEYKIRSTDGPHVACHF